MKAGGEPKLAARARSLEVSPTVAMAAKARALKAKGIKVYDFTVGEPDQPTPRHVAEAGKAAIDAGKTKYAPANGIPELRAAVVERYRADFSVSFAPEEVTIGVGGKQALALLYMAILDRGSEVVIPIPAWPTFAEAARVAGGTPVFVPLHVKDGYRVSASAIARKVGPKTRAVMVNSPSNPTGAVIEPAELMKLARLAKQKGFWLLYDDTYAHLTFGTNGPQQLQEVKDAAGGHLVVVGTASKSYCMTGWRIGAQALSGPQDEVRRMLAEYLRRRDFIQARVAAIPGVVCPVPDGAFYVFPDVSRCLSKALPDTLALGAKLLEEKAVAIVPGEGFQAPGTFRLSFATAFEDLQEGASRLAAFFAEHAPARRGAK